MKKFLLVFLFLGSILPVFSQSQKITGKVTGSDDGLPLPGATITVKGTSSGTQTSASGEYSITAAKGAILEFSFVGYNSQSITVGNATTINISLVSDSRILDEVIVSGVAGTTSRKNLTISVTKVNEERLNAVTATSMATSLSGKVAGLRISNPSGTPGTAANVLLRADNNLNNVGSGPLILIDGVIFQGSLSDLNADDVENMEIIKGAAASALYGSRAGNGVISITTKRGSRAELNKISVNVRNEYGIQQLPKLLDLATHHPYKLAADYQNYAGKYTKFDGVTYPSDYIGAGYNPAIKGNRAIDSDHYLDNPFGVNTNQQEEFFRTGNNMTNYVSLGSRSNKSSLFVSFENNQQSGIIMNTDGFSRQNFRVNYDLNVNKWLTLSSSNLFINTATNYPGSAGSVFFNIVLAEPDANLYQKNPDGQPYFLKINQFNGETINPLYNLYKVERDNKSRSWIGNYKANVKITEWANLDLSHSMEIRNYRYTSYTPKDYWTQTGGTPATFNMSYNNGSIDKYSDERNSQNTQFTLNLGKKFGDLDMRGKLSYLYENRQYEWYDVNASQLVVKDVITMDNFKTINDAYSGNETERAQNYFAIVGISYKDRYLFDGMYRYDGSSLFGPEARWNPYYRISGAYRISQDVKIPGIDELKIRSAYGTAGIRPGFDWQYETYTLTNGNTSPSQKGNIFLKPSTTAETEFGLNVDFLKKFTFEAVYAQSITNDQFLNVPLIPFLNDGYTSQYQNAGTVKSNTFEFTLGANWLKKKEFTWNSNVVFSRVRQKITELPIAPYVFGSTDGGAQSIFYVKEGEVYGAMYGNDWVKTLDQMSKQLPAGKNISEYVVNKYGYVVLANTIGTPQELSTKLRDENGNIWYGKIGDGNADFNMGIANTFGYKGLSLYTLFDIKKGGDIYNSKGQWITRDLRNPQMDMSGVADGQKTAYDYFLNFYDVNNPNSYWVEDGSFIKLREVALGYSIPKSHLSNFLKGSFKGATLKAVGRNLLTFTKYSGYDPEVGTVREPYDGTYKYPNFRNIAVSLSLDF